MPVPLSVIGTTEYGTAEGHGDRGGTAVELGTVDQGLLPRMASRAFITRLSSTWWSCPGSTLTRRTAAGAYAQRHARAERTAASALPRTSTSTSMLWSCRSARRQALGDPGRVLRRDLHRLELLTQGASRARLPQQQRGVSLLDRQQVVEVVGDAAGETTEGIHRC